MQQAKIALGSATPIGRFVVLACRSVGSKFAVAGLGLCHVVLVCLTLGWLWVVA